MDNITPAERKKKLISDFKRRREKEVSVNLGKTLLEDIDSSSTHADAIDWLNNR